MHTANHLFLYVVLLLLFLSSSGPFSFISLCSYFSSFSSFSFFSYPVFLPPTRTSQLCIPPPTLSFCLFTHLHPSLLQLHFRNLLLIWTLGRARVPHEINRWMSEAVSWCKRQAALTGPTEAPGDTNTCNTFCACHTIRMWLQPGATDRYL